VTSSRIDEVLGWLTGVDHEAISELHALGTSSTELARDDNLATLGTALHNESENTIASSSNGKTVEQLVSERFALSDSRETTILNLGGVEGDGVFGEFEALLDERCEFANASSLLAKDFLGVGCANDDVGDSGSDADFDTRVSLFSQLTLEEFVQLSVEDTICDELSPLRDSGTWNAGSHLVGYVMSEIEPEGRGSMSMLSLVVNSYSSLSIIGCSA